MATSNWDGRTYDNPEPERDAREIVLTPREVAGLRAAETTSPEFRKLQERLILLLQAVQSLDERDNGEAEARSALAAYTHQSVGELTEFATETVEQVTALHDRVTTLTNHTVLALKMLADAVDQLERGTLRSRLRRLFR